MNRIIRSGLKLAIAGACIAVFSQMGPVAQAREAVVTLKDGKQITGDVVGEDEGTVTLVIASIRTPMHVTQAALAGADGHLPKPITAPVLIGALQAVLTGPDAAADSHAA